MVGRREVNGEGDLDGLGLRSWMQVIRMSQPAWVAEAVMEFQRLDACYTSLGSAKKCKR